MTSIAILGLGEAGRLYARGFASAGATVRGYDPVRRETEGIDRAATIADAVADVDLVVSLTGAHAALDAARDAVGAMRAGAVFADFNTASPPLKAEVGDVAERAGVAASDVAVLAPVPRAGHRTPLVVAGPAAHATAGLLAPLGVPVDAIDGVMGDAARLKLLRTVFMKGLATLVIESLGGADAAGSGEWLRNQIARELGPDGAGLVERLVAGTYEHAHRREHEVRDALEELRSSGQPDDMTRGTLAWFERIMAERRD